MVFQTQNEQNTLEGRIKILGPLTTRENSVESAGAIIVPSVDDYSHRKAVTEAGVYETALILVYEMLSCVFVLPVGGCYNNTRVSLALHTLCNLSSCNNVLFSKKSIVLY